jgi:hypothetical protein
VRPATKGFEGISGEEPETYMSADPDKDAFLLRMLVGPDDGPGEESFDVLVCTPGWLVRAVSDERPQIGRRRLIVVVGGPTGCARCTARGHRPWSSGRYRGRHSRARRTCDGGRRTRPVESGPTG